HALHGIPQSGSTEHLMDRCDNISGRGVVRGEDHAHLLVRYPRCHPWLIIRDRHCQHRHAAGKGFKGRVQACVRDAQSTASEELDLGRVTHHHQIRRNGSELLRIELAADRKDKLEFLQSDRRLHNRTKNVYQSILERAHRSVDDRLACKLLPWKIAVHPSATIVEWSGIVELRKVGSATKVKCPRALGNPGKRGKSRMRIMPVNGESNLACVSLGRCRDRLQESSGVPDSLEISGQSINSSLVGPVDETDRSASRVIDVKSVGHMDEGHAKVHRYQFDIWLILI